MMIRFETESRRDQRVVKQVKMLLQGISWGLDIV